MSPLTSSLVFQILTAEVVGVICAAIIFILARRQHVTSRGWVLWSLVPGIGPLMLAAFLFLTVRSVLDRLDALEKNGRV